MRHTTLALGALMLAASGSASAETFHLICLGGGTANKFDVTNAYAANNAGGSAWATVEGRHGEGFADQVNIDIVDGVGNIRMPRTMLPPIHGGKDGWFELGNLKVGEQEITANAGVNFMNSPKVRIDRTTGILSISGKAGNFSARCRPYDPATVQKAF